MGTKFILSITAIIALVAATGCASSDPKESKGATGSALGNATGDVVVDEQQPGNDSNTGRAAEPAAQEQNPANGDQAWTGCFADCYTIGVNSARYCLSKCGELSAEADDDGSQPSDG